MKLIVMMDVGVENGYDEVNVQTSAKISLSAFLRQLSFVKNVTTKDLEIKPCSSLGWIKHQLSQGNGNVSKPSQSRSLRSDRAFSKHRYDTNPCNLIYSLMLSPEDRSKPISCFSTFVLGKYIPVLFPPASRQDSDPRISDKWVPWVPTRGNPRLNPWTLFPSKKWKPSDKEKPSIFPNMEEFSLMKPTSRRLYKSDNSPQAKDRLLQDLETRVTRLDG
ncbi:hypothetical protein DY000_02042888 [Brassica cretica]|uniref:BURP domain-containing protein n=1 Tax=Brassica cretica TaxID=69181 RepID=A0ABQ7BJ60_BRACR|nr:hypothetical protein DY000_02042888 [Brassica cretica]